MSRPCRRLDAIFDTPSSPLAPPSAENANSSTTPAGSPPSRRISSAPVTPTNRSHSREASSSPYAAARNNRRNRLTSSRTTEDFTQVGVLAARKLKLKPESLLALEDFAKMLKVTEMQALLSPAAAVFTIPKKLDNKIDVHSIRTLLSPTLCHYVKKAGGDTPSGIMKSLIQEHATTWGLTADNVDDKNQWGVVTTRGNPRVSGLEYHQPVTRTRSTRPANPPGLPEPVPFPTDRRYEIKKVLCDAMWVSVKGEDGEVIITNLEEPSDIIKLCEAVSVEAVQLI
ncbi:hypothetical protein B0H10DRAFT_1954845 [Mycena sp. CBHHK59/15]|nr:hypothetical protein B0H10DRAFT_1954845 [Mycena sp. CBHHK59/15]